ncbi:MAG: hypothetical protein ACRENP_13800 [Longimicrobiales bacterium]
MRRTIALALAASSTLIAGQVAAQACIGLPSSDRQATLSGNVGFLENARTYGGSGSYNLGGPITVGAAVSITKPENVNEDITNFGVLAAYDLGLSGFSACPSAGAQYSSFSTQFFGSFVDATALIVPIGLGLGTSIPVGTGNNTRLLLSAGPQYLYIRTNVDIDTPLGSGEGSRTDHEFGATLGLVLHLSQLYAGAGVSFNTVEDSEATFGVNLGLVLGRWR